jgi:hypothetical protein
LWSNLLRKKENSFKKKTSQIEFLQDAFDVAERDGKINYFPDYLASQSREEDNFKNFAFEV